MHTQVRRVLRRDQHMRRLMEALGPAPIGQRDLFEALTRAVISQMLSVDAARAILGRLQTRVGLEPARLARVQRRTLWKLGLSKAKAECIRTVAKRFVAGDFHSLPRCSDEEVYARLTAIKGIGRWTAEMVMIFSLGRPDVWPVADGGIQRAVANLYGVGREGLEGFGDRFRPVRSYACWYLWRSLDKREEGGGRREEEE